MRSASHTLREDAEDAEDDKENHPEGLEKDLPVTYPSSVRGHFIRLAGSIQKTCLTV